MGRKLKILEILNESNSWVKGSEFAELLGVSSRTIRNDIRELKKEFLEEVILTSKTKGYKLNKVYLSSMKDENISNYTSHNERLIQILKIILINESGIDIYKLANELYVSEHTLDIDLNILKKYIKSTSFKNARLIRKGDLIILSSNYLDRNSIFYETYKIMFRSVRFSELNKVFTEFDLLKLYKIIRNVVIENELDSRYISLKRLTVDFALIIERDCVDEKSLKKNLHSDDISYKIYNELEKNLNIKLDSKKLNYISHRLFKILMLQEIEGKYRRYENNDSFAINIKNVLQNIGEVIGLDLLSDEDLINKLISHLRITIERKKLGFTSPNPLIDNLKNECQFIFSFALYIIDSLAINMDINDISYVVAYLLIIITENIKSYESYKLIVGVVVADGVANLEYISNAIKYLDEKRQCDINKFLRADEIEDEGMYDILISTSNSILNYKNGITINKEFTKLDTIKIKTSLDKAIIEKRKNMLNKNVCRLISDNIFCINDKIKSKEEAIRYLSGKLEQEGYVNAEFYRSVLHREKLISSRLESGIAIPHSYDYKANKSGIAILIAKNGMDWGGKKVKIVMLIALEEKNKAEFIKFSSEFNKILIENNVCDYMLSSTSSNKFKTNIENFLTC